MDYDSPAESTGLLAWYILTVDAMLFAGHASENIFDPDRAGVVVWGVRLVLLPGLGFRLDRVRASDASETGEAAHST